MQKQEAPAQAMSGVNISKRRKFVADGVFYAELNEFFQRELAEEGYSGVEVRVTPTVTDIIIRATHTQEVLGEQGRRIRELTSLITHRFRFPPDSVSLYAAKVQSRGLSAVAQCESLRYKLLNGLAVRRACYGVLRFIMESGAKGCEVVVSGKLRAARAKSMKFTDGFMIHSGQPAKDFIDNATRHVLLRQGVLGIKVKIMRALPPRHPTRPARRLAARACQTPSPSSSLRRSSLSSHRHRRTTVQGCPGSGHASSRCSSSSKLLRSGGCTGRTGERRAGVLGVAPDALLSFAERAVPMHDEEW
ncbi:40S ribosomal protein S3 [Hortaea werneckii EXF-2000]|uniref:40S ribosomal protein S3 n=1 Tax=Hortaea werneckii EXF-2000 TaxID=1157616 RepID=A0A1Z5T802_HORWE|nr:40S ribosomal protein S3 [Hortaea werneckii EXF-2000]